MSAGEEARGIYVVRVREAIKQMRRLTGMSGEQFAKALSRELGREIYDTRLYEYEAGRRLPHADVFLAMQVVSNAVPRNLDLGTEGIVNLARRVNEIESLLVRMTKKANLVVLPEAIGPVTDYVTATEAAAITKRTRSIHYHYGEQGKIRMFRLGARTVFLRREVEELARELAEREAAEAEEARKHTDER